MASGPIIICEPAEECRDPHTYRWFCMRGHALDGKPRTLGVCHLAKCAMADAKATS